MLNEGTTLGPYTIVAPLGAGGMGEVYRARDTRLGRDVAVKVLPTSFYASEGRAARFAREARTLSQLNHPHICTLHDVGHDGGVDYLVMEFIEGETLAQRLLRGPLGVEELLGVAEQVAGALAVAHRLGLVHRDLKPANLMQTLAGVKLLDFGLAMPAVARARSPLSSQAPTADSPLTAAGAVVGTFQYMAPEQLEGLEADARTDIFALGCVLYELGTGERPFRGHDRATMLASLLRERPEPLPRVNPAMPERLGEIVSRCLEQEPERRYADAAELAADLARLRTWARDEGVPELARICERILVVEEGRDSWDAFLLAREIDKLAPGDPIVERLRPDFSQPASFVSDPPGAEVFASYYGDADDARVRFGVTPLESVPFPRGLTRLSLELPGLRPARDLAWYLSKQMNDATDAENLTWSYRLHRPGEIPDEMDAVPAGGFPMYLPGLDHLETEPTVAFLVDRHPVTNLEYKRFMDDRGYERPEFWTGPFLDGERELPFDELIARLTDSVGRPGPATWQMGEYPEGDADHPVAGVSWYEAAAYAAWAGKELPTIFHWSRVAFTFCSAQIAPLANYGGRGTVPVGKTRSVNRFGAHDLAGNVREWVVNAVDRAGQRFILGGGWNDPGYSFVDAYAQAALDRSTSNGFRCIRVLEPEPRRAELARTIEFQFRDFRAEQPVPDAVFDFFLRQFHYDRTPLEPVQVARQEIPTGIWETVEVAAAYGGERMQLQLFLPARGKPPYQVALVFPGSLALHNRAFNLSEFGRLDFLVKSGRAVLLPIYKGTYERGSGMTSDYPEETTFYKDHVIAWGRDLGRAVDYVETRADLDAGRIAYYGTSWGGALGAILPAVEKRIRTNVLYVAGLSFQRALPEVDALNYVTRVTQPTLMLNGEMDFFFPAETSQKPMFDLLGTPPEHKKRLTYPRGHTVPKTELIRESVAWLDKYLGPVG